MKTIKNQNGVATVLMVILIGISIMAVTVTTARSYMSKKESNVAAHAQVNSQIMSWAGVNAFRQYILKTGEEDFEAIKLLQGTEVVLSNVQGQKNVRANNIKVTGCTTETDECIVEADISAKNLSSKSANTLQIVFDVTLKNLGVTIPKVGASTFGGGLVVEGTIGAEDPGSSVTINVDGNVLFKTAARLENISNLTINATGDVEIRCIVTPGICGSGANIDIHSKGKITITDTGYGTFGNLYANGKINLSATTAKNLATLDEVELWLGTKVKDIQAGKDITIHTGSKAGNIEACANVTVTGINAEAEDIKAGGDVVISIGGEAANIHAEGQVILKPTGILGDLGVSGGKAKNIYSAQFVELTGSSEADNIETLGYVYLYGSTAYGYIKAKGTRTTSGNAVHLRSHSRVDGHVYAGGKVTLGSGINANNITATGNVEIDGLGGSKPRAGDIYSNGNVYIRSSNVGDITSGGNVNLRIDGKAGRVTYVGDLDRYWAWPSGEGTSYNEVSAISPVQPVTLDALTDYTPVDCPVMKQEITDTINEYTDNIAAYVSVEAYKDEANYIFTKNNGVTRVYLNKLKNTTDGTEYLYENNAQYVVSIDGTKSLSNGASGEPFHIGKYTLNGNTYTGAICELANNGYCSSDIIGYLPRISLVENPSVQGGLISRLTGLFANLIFEGNNGDYQYISNSKFIISSVAHSSSIANATLAPGIMYFDDDLVIRGNGISAATGSDRSAYINSFLAEGNIDAALFSPNIYSPYNALRETDESVVCDRSLKTVTGGIGPFITSPNTVSNKYLRATNLCKSGSEFSHSMNRDPDNDRLITSVTIDGETIPKLDLGYVALMSGKTIRLMFCSQIYGDVLAKGAIRTTTELICGGGDRQTVTGSMTSQTGENSHLGSDTNKIHTASKYVIANPEYSNYDGGQDVPEPQDQLATDSVTVKWARSK